MSNSCFKRLSEFRPVMYLPDENIQAHKIFIMKLIYKFVYITSREHYTAPLDYIYILFSVAYAVKLHSER